MPEITRIPLRMDCPLGLNLVDALDRMRPGSFPYLVNVRCVEEGILESRPGYSTYGSVTAIPASPNLLHSIRRLNDPDESQAAAGYIYVVGNGTTIDAGIESALVQVDTGYSGNPLSLLAFRPDQSPESWMYVYDSAKQSKISAGGQVRAIGVAPPNAAPICEYGVPANVDLNTGQVDTSWTFSGAVVGIGNPDRTNVGGYSIYSVLYDAGTTGWCCIVPSADTSPWDGERMKVILNAGGGNQESVMVREIHRAIAATTIAGIEYDSGTTGLCCIILTGNPAGLARNSLLQLVTQAGDGATEVVRVLSVTTSPDGSTYSIRCSALNKHSAAATVTGGLSWYTYTAQNHVAAETITTSYISASQAVAGTGQIQLIAAPSPQCGTANGRSIDPANDYLHVSGFFQNPQNIISLNVLVDIDPATATGSTPFTGSFWTFTIPQAQIGSFTKNSGDVWTDVVIPISQGVQTGSPSLTFAGVQAVGLQLITSGACSWGFDWLYFFGTYGPVIQPNAPTGYFYDSTFRDSSTGAVSVPGPTTRFSMYPLREDVIVTPATTTAVGVNYCDVYREGGTLTTFNYIGSCTNNHASPQSYDDTLSDLSISNNAEVDLTQLQPWPVLGLPLTGIVNVVGTSVQWVSGNTFPLPMISNTVILLNGVAYETRGQPHSTTFLELELSAGNLTNATYLIASPTLAGQPLPLAFGPLEGPFAPVAFALGDMVNSGTLYFSNTSNLDSASDQNTLELCGPTEPLVTGEVWNGLAFAGSRENVYLVRYSFLASQGGTPYQFSRLPGASGFWSRWAICRGPDGVYALGRDGVYLWNESGGINISDSLLYPLFPHDGQPAVGANGLLPVDMTQIAFMRLSYTDESVRFTYLDTAANQVTLRYEIARKRWFLHSYGDEISLEYLNEGLVSSPNNLSILQLSRTLGLIYQAGGNTDAGVAINSLAQTPYMDGGDFRSQHLYIDYLVDADQAGSLEVAAFFNNGVSNAPSVPLALTGPRTQFPIPVSSVPSGLALYRNVSIKFAWTGGPAGPRIYGTEVSGYNQAYLCENLDTQYFGLSFPGWKCLRRSYPALISNSPVTFLIRTQDGRNYSIVIPSTGGQLLQQPIMLPQTCKSLLFAFQLSAGGSQFAVFTDEFVLEAKEWSEPSYVKLAVFRA